MADRFTGTFEEECASSYLTSPAGREKMVRLFDEVFGKDVPFYVFYGDDDDSGNAFWNSEHPLAVDMKTWPDEDVDLGHGGYFAFSRGNYLGCPIIFGGYGDPGCSALSFIYCRESDREKLEAAGV